ncbi:hypothetical protein DZF91_22255 [Actinomadura logoneensis]|uniref:Uncharacterized protein n=1 Tax=Actinomadura logoneensis TaxID=2293572 RepID=A0A372JHK0_9ACTN|nr:hypothetical protein [Actinomadura logoneensis]RFU39481.1 hypothetical protein DZF91_22255 [Actinomadura logoneensis]
MGQPTFPPPPAPPGGGGSGGAVIFIVIAVVALVLIGGGVGAMVLLSGDDKPKRHVAVVPPSAAPSSPSGLGKRPTSGGGGGTSDPWSILTRTIRTAKGNSYTQAGTRSEPCVLRANTQLLSTLRAHPCTGRMASGVYLNSSRTIVTVLSLARFGSPADARAVVNSLSRHAEPKLLGPSKSSGIPLLRGNPERWTRTYSRGSSVVFAQSYYARGGAAGGAAGPVNQTASELGVEVQTTLLWKN